MGGRTDRGRHVKARGSDSAVELRQLRAFVTCVERGSVSRAAVALGLAQSTVSETLAALDRAMGTPVLVRRRGAHQLALTVAGEALLPHARALLQELEATHRAVAAASRAASARLDVLANESVSTYLLPPVLGALRKQWPNVRFAVSVETCATIRAGVAGGKCDVGLLLEEQAADGATPASGNGGGPERIALSGKIPLVIFSGPDHPLSRDRARARARDDMADFPLFVADAAGDFFELLRRYLTAGGLPGPRLQPAGSIEAVRRGVAADPSALGVLPQFALSDDLEAGRARAITTRPAPPAVRLVALLPATPSARHPAVAELLERLHNA